MTLNTWNFGTNVENGFEKMAYEIIESRADIILLQVRNFHFFQFSIFSTFKIQEVMSQDAFNKLFKDKNYLKGLYDGEIPTSFSWIPGIFPLVIIITVTQLNTVIIHTGNGIIWLRRKFSLVPESKAEFRIGQTPTIRVTLQSRVG